MVTRGMPPLWITFNPSDLRCLIVLWLAGAANPATLADPSGNQPTGAQTMHVLCTQGRDGARGVAQLWSVGRIEYATLQMRKF